MKCLKCFKQADGVKPKNLPVMLSHLANFTVCNDCDDTGKYEKDYYIRNKVHYRELHKSYKSNLTDSYVANTFADKTSLKAKDIPKAIIEAKRNYMKLKRLTKEERHGR